MTFSNPQHPKHDGGADAALSADDQRALDALVEAGFDRTRLDLSLTAMSMADPARCDRERVEAITRLLGLMRDYPVDDADVSLIDATLARIDRHDRQQAERLRFDS